ncbi:uncharacterized protein J3R85_007843, partial [Psidium guajava]
MASSNSRESDPSRRLSLPSASSLANPVVSTSDLLTTIDRANSSSAMTGRSACAPSSTPSSESTLLDASVALADPPAPLAARTVDDVWREIVAGQRRECKEEMPDEMMTLEDFLVKAGAAVGVEDEEVKVKVPPDESSGAFSFDATAPSTIETAEGSI